MTNLNAPKRQFNAKTTYGAPEPDFSSLGFDFIQTYKSFHSRGVKKPDAREGIRTPESTEEQDFFFLS